MHSRTRHAHRGLLVLTLGWVALTYGCAGHADQTKLARTALDAGKPKAALAALNEQLGVEKAEEVPPKIGDDQILFVLDRSMVLQAVDKYSLSSRDLELADKQVEVLDFSRGALDDIGKYIFSDDSGPYQAPPYEKLLINTMGMLNYLVRGDLNGARIEARRFATMQKFISEHEDHGKSLSGPGSYLAGFTFEKSGRASEALRYYDDALQYGEYESLREPVQRLAARDSYRTPRLSKLIGDEGLRTGTQGADTDDQSGELLIVINYGRVPPKIAKRVPIGLALTYASAFLSPHDVSKANYLAGQGLVTWVNYPELGKPRGDYGVPEFYLDNQQRQLDGLLAVDLEAQRAWKDVQGAIIASAITRLITRVVAGEATRQAAGGGTLGALLSLGTQATMTALDTPDTRSWATLPARIAVARVRVPPGKHVVRLRARGAEKSAEVQVPASGYAVVSLTALR